MVDTVFVSDFRSGQEHTHRNGSCSESSIGRKKTVERGGGSGDMRSEMEEREESKKMISEPLPFSPVSVLQWSASGDEDTRYDKEAELSDAAVNWAELVDTTVSHWNSWEAPAPHGFWLDPDLTPRDLRAGYQGTAASLLALFSCFPTSSTLADHLTKHLYTFWQWNDWLQRYAEPCEMASIAKFLQQGLTEHLHQDEQGNSTQEGPLNILGGDFVFPQRLDQKYPCKKEEFMNVLSLMKLWKVEELQEAPDHSRNARKEERQIGWLTLYLCGWLVYAQEGLACHIQVREACRSGCQSISVASFLEYRALSSPLWILFSAASQSASGVNFETAYSILPLLVQAAMLVGIDSDLLLAARNKTGSSSSVSTLLLFPHKTALEIHSALLFAYAKTRSSVISSNAELVPVVELLEGTVHGLMTWHDFAQKHEAPAGTCGRWRPRLDSNCVGSFVSGSEKLAKAIQEATARAVDRAWEVLQLEVPGS